LEIQFGDQKTSKIEILKTLPNTFNRETPNNMGRRITLNLFEKISVLATQSTTANKAEANV